MNNKRTIFFLTIFVLMFPFIVYAGGSTYSRYGYGDLLRFGDSRLYAMGGTGIALIDDGFINGLNPAGLARISYTQFEGGFEFDKYYSKDNTASSQYMISGLQGLSFAVPISRDNGIVLSLASAPVSRVRYAIDYSYLDSSIGSIKHQSFYGSGGLSSLGIGLSGSILSTLHIGGRFEYIYGRTRQYQLSSFDNTDLTNTSVDQSVYYSGLSFTFGTIFEGLQDIFNAPSLRDITIGITISAPTSLDAERQISILASDSTFSSSGTSDLPLSMGLGLSYLSKNRYRFASDFVYENWGSAKLLGSDAGTLRNSFRASLGFEATPLKDADTYMKRIIYRAGLVYNSTYYKVNGIGINEFLISGGVGLPLGPDSRLNIGLQLGFRGTMDNNLQKDTIIRLSIGLSASEIWFLKFEEE